MCFGFNFVVVGFNFLVIGFNFVVIGSNFVVIGSNSPLIGSNFVLWLCMQGCSSSLAVGAGEGQFGIWFDEDLNHGRSQACPTFDNPPLTPTEDFR